MLSVENRSTRSFTSSRIQPLSTLAVINQIGKGSVGSVCLADGRASDANRPERRSGGPTVLVDHCKAARRGCLHAGATSSLERGVHAARRFLPKWRSMKVLLTHPFGRFVADFTRSCRKLLLRAARCIVLTGTLYG